MRITLLCVGKTDDGQLAAIIDKFQQRLKHYIPFSIVVIPDAKNTKHMRADQQRAREAAGILKQLSPGDHVVLLDERGKEYRSVEFAAHLNKLMVGSVQHVVFVVGGSYGFEESVYKRANNNLSYSKMTFSHPMFRLFLL